MSNAPNSDSKNTFLNWVGSRKAVINVQKFLRQKSLWGVEGMNLYDVLRFFGLGLINGSVSIRAASISFRLLLAFFPAMILLLSLLPHTPLDSNAVMDALLLLFPGETVNLFEQTVTDLLDKSYGSVLSI